MNRTTIEWVKNPDGSPGYTWNPITGCLNHVDGLCKGGGFPCYAYKLAHGRLKHHYLKAYALPKDKGILADSYPTRDPFYPRFWEERLYHSWGGKPRGIFVCDMSDIFGIGIPEEWTESVMNLIRKHDENRYYLLTKQPQNLIKWSPFPDNCWVGVTITNEATLLKATTNLGYIDAKVKFISFEPLLERLPLPYYQMNSDWLIIGACTGSCHDMLKLAYSYEGVKYPIERLMADSKGKVTYQPKIEWVQEIVEAADEAGVKVFLKDNLMPLFKRGDIWAIPEWASFNDWSKQDIGTTLRQEMPE